MLQERIDNYKRDVTNWISKQGLLYQIFRAPALMGSTAGVGSFILGLLIKVFIALIILSIITLLVLSQTHTKKSFSSKISGKIKSSLKAQEVTMKEAKGGLLSNTVLPEINILGGEGSFFTRLAINSASLDLGQLPGIKKTFNSGRVACSKITCFFKTGQEGESPIYAPLFDTESWFNFQSLEARDFEAYWGYSEKTGGVIKNGKLTMARKGGGWEATITGGTISYAWIKEADIKQIKIIAKQDHFEITEAEFYKGDTTFTLAVKVDEFGDKIKLSGGGKIKNCKTEYVFRKKYQPYVTGNFSAEYTIGGFLNSTEGLDFTFKPLLREIQEGEQQSDSLAVEYYPNRFFVKHEIPIWKALTTLDNSIDNYELIPFDETDWTVELKDGEIHLKDGKFSNKTDDRIILDLSFQLKSPKEEYIIRAASGMSKAELISLLEKDDSLRRKAIEIIHLRSEFSDAASFTLYDKLDKDDFLEILKEERHFFGNATIKLTPLSLNGQNQQKLTKALPVELDGRRIIKVPLEGKYEEVTMKTALELYELGKKIK